MDVFPLIFEPIFKPKIWGGRALESALGKHLPATAPIGESWEIADLEEDQSIVARGPAKGVSLGQLVAEWKTQLLGSAELFEGRFPFLIKFLDANEMLSVQVHPDKAMAARLGGRVRVKNEAWYVVDAAPEGFIYRGVKPGVDRDQFRAAIESGEVETLLNRIPVRKGHCYYLPSGTVHALGGGVLVAEVQTPSDITYRVFDFNRVEANTGQPRALHIDEALECISFDSGPIQGEEKEHMASVWTSVTRLVRCDSFIIERVRMVEGVEQAIPHTEMMIWIVLEGRGTIACQGSAEPVPFSAGDTVLLPAAMKDGHLSVQEDSMWLEVSAPIPSALPDLDAAARQSLKSSDSAGDAVVQINLPKDE